MQGHPGFLGQQDIQLYTQSSEVAAEQAKIPLQTGG